MVKQKPAPEARSRPAQVIEDADLVGAQDAGDAAFASRLVQLRAAMRAQGRRVAAPRWDEGLDHAEIEAVRATLARFLGELEG